MALASVSVVTSGKSRVFFSIWSPLLPTFSKVYQRLKAKFSAVSAHHENETVFPSTSDVYIDNIAV